MIFSKHFLIFCMATKSIHDLPRFALRNIIRQYLKLKYNFFFSRNLYIVIIATILIRIDAVITEFVDILLTKTLLKIECTLQLYIKYIIVLSIT